MTSSHAGETFTSSPERRRWRGGKGGRVCLLSLSARERYRCTNRSRGKKTVSMTCESSLTDESVVFPFLLNGKVFGLVSVTTAGVIRTLFEI